MLQLTVDLIDAVSLLKIDFFLYWLENFYVDLNVLLKISLIKTARVVTRSFFIFFQLPCTSYQSVNL